MYFMAVAFAYHAHAATDGAVSSIVNYKVGER